MTCRRVMAMPANDDDGESVSCSQELQEAARAHEIVESRGVQGRVVLDVDAACWD